MGRPQFKAGLEQTRSELEDTLRLWGIGKKDYHIRTSADRVGGNVFRHSVEVSFTKGGIRVRVTCESYLTEADNLRACYLRIHNARLDDRRGTQRWEESLRPYLQLPAGKGQAASNGQLPPPAPASSDEDPWAVLGILRGAPAEVVKAVYRVKIAGAHPDAPGGSHGEAKRVNDAYARVMAELGERT